MNRTIEHYAHKNNAFQLI